MDKHEIRAIGSVPRGYARVAEGVIEGDDLCWSVMEGRWRRFGGGGWLNPATLAEDAFCVVRKAGHAAAEGQAVRNYSIRREEMPQQKGQMDLF